MKGRERCKKEEIYLEESNNTCLPTTSGKERMEDFFIQVVLYVRLTPDTWYQIVSTNGEKWIYQLKQHARTHVIDPESQAREHVQ